MLNRHGFTTRGIFRALPGMPVALKSLRGARLADGTFIFGGGINGLGEYQNTLFRFNPRTQTFSTEAATLTDLMGDHVAFGAGGAVVFAGGGNGTIDYKAQAEIVEVDAAGAITVSAVGSMTTGRNLAVAGTTADERGFVISGVGSSGLLGTTEIFSFKNKTFSVGSAMPAGRYDSALSPTNMGHLFMLGGRDGGGIVSASNYTYNAHTDTWSAKATVLSPRAGHTQLSMLGGEVLVLGGITNDTGPVLNSTMEIYYPEVDPSMVIAGTSPSVTNAAGVSGDGVHLVVGGDNGSAPVSNCWIQDEIIHTTFRPEGMLFGGKTTAGASASMALKYNSATDTFAAVQALPAAVREAAGGNYGGTGIIMGGIQGASTVIASGSRWNADTEVVSTMPGSLGLARYGAGGMLTSNQAGTDEVFRVVGGKNASNLSVNNVDTLSPSTMTFSSGPNLTGTGIFAVSHMGCCGVKASNGRREGVAIGGLDTAGSFRDQVFRLSTSAGTWSVSAQTLSVPRARMACASSRNRVVLAGGTQILAGTPLSIIQVYNYDTDSMSTFSASLVNARRDATAIPLGDGRVLVAGGFDGSNAMSSCEIIDLEHATVRQAGNLPEALSCIAATGPTNQVSRPVRLIPEVWFQAIDTADEYQSGGVSMELPPFRPQRWDIHVQVGIPLQVSLYMKVNGAYSDVLTGGKGPVVRLSGAGLKVENTPALNSSTWVQVIPSGTPLKDGVIQLEVINRSDAPGARLYIDNIGLL